MKMEDAQRVKQLLNDRDELIKFKDILILNRDNFSMWFSCNNEAAGAAINLTPVIAKCLMRTLNRMIADIEDEIDKIQ